MSNVFCIRADSGLYTEYFLRGGYAGIGWSEISRDLSIIHSRDELYPLVRAAYPDVQSTIVILSLPLQIRNGYAMEKWQKIHRTTLPRLTMAAVIDTEGELSGQRSALNEVTSQSPFRIRFGPH